MGAWFTAGLISLSRALRETPRERLEVCRGILCIGMMSEPCAPIPEASLVSEVSPGSVLGLVADVRMLMGCAKGLSALTHTQP